MGRCACGGFGGLPQGLFTSPLRELAISKVAFMLVTVFAFACWFSLRSQLLLSTTFFWTAMGICLLLLLHSLSLIFLVHKFYWNKVETLLSLGTVLVSILLCLLQYSYDIESGFDLKLLRLCFAFVSLGSVFTAFWSHFKTPNSVSNLYIPHWGDNEDNIEIEFLQNDFNA